MTDIQYTYRLVNHQQNSKKNFFFKVGAKIILQNGLKFLLGDTEETISLAYISQSMIER